MVCIGIHGWINSFRPNYLKSVGTIALAHNQFKNILWPWEPDALLKILV